MSKSIPSDVIGIIAQFTAQTTEGQRTLMLVCSTWYRGVIEQDGMKPKPGIFWPWCALQERQPSGVSIGCSHIVDVVAQIAATLPRLKQLKLYASGSIGLVHLAEFVHLESLHLTTQRQQAATPCVEQIASAVRNGGLRHLKALRLPGLTFTDGDLELLVEAGAAGSLQNSPSSAAGTSMIDTLTALDISNEQFECSQLTDDGIQLVTGQFSNLQELLLDRCNDMTDLALKHIAEGCKALTSLDISHNEDNVTDVGLQYLCGGVGKDGGRFARQLRKLSMGYCFSVTDDGMQHIFRTMTNLTSLDMSCCTLVTDAALMGALQKEEEEAANNNDSEEENSASCVGPCTMKQLQCFRCNGCEDITDDGIVALVRANPHLTDLSLDETKITGVGIQCIAECAPQLETLSLEMCRGVNDGSFKPITQSRNCATTLSSLNVSYTSLKKLPGFSSLQSLTALSVEGLSPMKQDTSTAAVKELSALTQLRDVALPNTFTSPQLVELLHGYSSRLHSFRVVMCPSVCDLTFQAVQEKLCGLTTLDIEECENMTHDAVEHIVNGSPHLTVLNLSCSDNITDRGVQCITNKLTELRSLNVCGCSQLTDAAFSTIGDLQHLTALDVSLCRELTDRTMEYVASAQLHRLQSVSIMGCDRITRGEGMAQHSIMPNVVV